MFSFHHGNTVAKGLWPNTNHRCDPSVKARTRGLKPLSGLQLSSSGEMAHNEYPPLNTDSITLDFSPAYGDFFGGPFLVFKIKIKIRPSTE